MRAVIAGLLALLLWTLPAASEERIRSFVSDATVKADASVEVIETITVVAEQVRIRHGIYRDFPTTYDSREGTRVKVGFEVISVKLDGQSAEYAIESISNGKRVKIGSADSFVSPGVHSYELRYRTTRQLGFFPDYDEFYWNVTGNDWEFVIDRAVSRVHLPPGARILQHAAYTGHQGASGQDFRVLKWTGTEYEAETVRPLGTGEGFTIAVAWQKGIVAAPTDAEKRLWWLQDNAGLFVLVLCLVIVGLYYLYAWSKVGRDPPAGVIVPLFTPPPALGAAGTRFVWKQGFDDRTFAAATVGLAVKGRLKIFDDDGDFAIERKSAPGQPLTASEGDFLASLPASRLELKQKNHSAVGAARSALKKALAKEFEGSVFVRNVGWFAAGAVISVAGLLIAALLLPAEDGIMGLFAVGWTGIWWSVVIGVAWGMIRGVIAARGVLAKIVSVLGLFFLLPFVIGGVAAPGAILFAGGGSLRFYLLVGTAVLLAAMNAVFYYLLKAPTLSGRRLLDRIEGFRMYMTTAEEERLKVLNPPEKTPELFERYLPYALALDCENEWNAKFAAVLAAATAAGAAGPSWYSGTNWNSGNLGSFTDSLGSSLASRAAAASTAPGSSSGSGGGGSSGGGGGGGGGGGW